MVCRSVGKLQEDNHLQRGDLKQVLGVSEPRRHLGMPLNHNNNDTKRHSRKLGTYQAGLPCELAARALVAIEMLEAVAVEP